MYFKSTSRHLANSSDKSHLARELLRCAPSSCLTLRRSSVSKNRDTVPVLHQSRYKVNKRARHSVRYKTLSYQDFTLTWHSRRLERVRREKSCDYPAGCIHVVHRGEFF